MAVTYTDRISGEQRVLFDRAVLEDRERNMYDDSDFYAIVWDRTKGRIVTHEYASTRYAGGGTCRVDADAATWREVGDHCRAALPAIIYADVQTAACRPEVGRRVRVAKGRKVPIGTVGILGWIGPAQTYGGHSRWSQTTVRRVRIDLGDETEMVEVTLRNGRKVERTQHTNVAWTYLDNLEVVDPKQYETTTLAEIEANVAAMDDKRAYSLYRGYTAGRAMARAGLVVM